MPGELTKLWSGLGNVKKKKKESKDKLKSFLMRVQEESEKAGLKLNIKKKTQIMASGPIPSWQIEEENGEAVTEFLFLGSKITSADD